MLFQTFIRMAAVVAGVLLVPTHAHPGEVEPTLTSRELDHRRAAIEARHAVVRNCDGAITAFEARRRARRSALIGKRHCGNPDHHHTATSTAHKPTYTILQNTTCVLTPENIEGPFYIHEELLRTNVRDGMHGVPLLLDFGVMDVTTCTPMENALVDIWHSNATGVYSGFIASEASNTGPVTSSASTSASGPPPLTLATDQKTFGRGAYPTDSNGLVEFLTVFPGFYVGRAVHIHAAVLTNYTTNKNGTIGLEAGKTRHIGQVYFEESWTELVMATPPYNQETVQRTVNDADMFYPLENTAGYNATAQLTMLGKHIHDGLLGYVTLGVNPTASYAFQDPSYYTGKKVD
jgi:protocatechuate 3,4-dioxygenase beta subunit